MNCIRKYRLEKGFTMAELGKRVGCSEASISYYELGKREAKYETLLKIAEVLETTVDSLLGHSKNDIFSSFSSKVDQMNTDLWASKHAAASAEYSALASPDMTDEQKQDLAESIRSRYEGFHISERSDIVSSLSKLTDEQLDDMFFTLIKGRDKDYLLKLASKILEIAAEK